MRIGERLRLWARRRREGGASVTGVALELPRLLARKGSNLVLQQVNRVRGRAYQTRYGSDLRRAFDGAGKNPYTMVVVPGILHYVIPCLTFVARHVPVVLLGNGTRRWEDELLEQRFPDARMVKLHPVKGSLLPHGDVLDLVLRYATRSLTLLDPDLFVFNPDVFAEMRLRDGEAACGAFGFVNRKAALVFPTTHLLTLNLGCVQELMARYRIGPAIYGSTPPHLIEPLGRIGLGDRNYPKEYLSFFDPLTLILALAAHDGLALRVLNRGDADVFHVGGVSYLDQNVILDFVNARLLDLPFARPLRDRYGGPRSGTANPEEARRRAIEAGAEGSLTAVDRAIDRIADTMAGQIS
jgi:hypothetical protein